MEKCCSSICEMNDKAKLICKRWVKIFSRKFLDCGTVVSEYCAMVDDAGSSLACCISWSFFRSIHYTCFKSVQNC